MNTYNTTGCTHTNNANQHNSSDGTIKHSSKHTYTYAKITHTSPPTSTQEPSAPQLNLTVKQL